MAGAAEGPYILGFRVALEFQILLQQAAVFSQDSLHLGLQHLNLARVGRQGNHFILRHAAGGALDRQFEKNKMEKERQK
jgi:hypothetical protein